MDNEIIRAALRPPPVFIVPATVSKQCMKDMGPEDVPPLVCIPEPLGLNLENDTPTPPPVPLTIRVSLSSCPMNSLLSSRPRTLQFIINCLVLPLLLRIRPPGIKLNLDISA